jgi:hypothetical protein
MRVPVDRGRGVLRWWEKVKGGKESGAAEKTRVFGRKPGNENGEEERRVTKRIHGEIGLARASLCLGRVASSVETLAQTRRFAPARPLVARLLSPTCTSTTLSELACPLPSL